MTDFEMILDVLNSVPAESFEIDGNSLKLSKNEVTLEISEMSDGWDDGYFITVKQKSGPLYFTVWDGLDFWNIETKVAKKIKKLFDAAEKRYSESRTVRLKKVCDTLTKV